MTEQSQTNLSLQQLLAGYKSFLKETKKEDGIKFYRQVAS